MQAYVEETNRERQKLEQEKADIKEREEKMRKSLQAEFDKKEKELQERRDDLAAEIKDWEEEKERVKQTRVFEKVVTLDVGGTKYRTTLSTLTKYPDSMLGAMFSGRHDLPQQEDGSYFIDRDGEAFKYVLMYLRDSDLCFDVLYDADQSSLPSPLTKPLLKQIAYEAEYFQFKELETKVRIILNLNRAQYQHGRAFSFSAHQKHNGYSFYLAPQSYGLDYVQDELQCQQFTNKAITFTHHIINVVCDGKTGYEFMNKVTFDSCDLSDASFCKSYFQEGVSFEGCILRGAKFECVGGLVRHKVHFAPWQVAQAKFEPELLQALKDNGCIY